ncbi:hypothetical protein [Pseudomonas sp. R5(2019)]|uniref:hypothetical protein n=1 Tax=Pseudomonas sp. R5(2019) TaxID=2697566 RepID=UPI0014134DA2|nr:hypothetical protein [Pseudomonas sp. R5(2019)]NBA94782.1 hypothetical protein [Pseudomonas sp. R5(2019)]
MYTYRPEFFRRGDQLLTSRLDSVKRQIFVSASEHERLLTATNELVARDHVLLEKYLVPKPEPGGYWMPILRILIQAQAIALDASPEEKQSRKSGTGERPVNSKNDAALHELSLSEATREAMCRLEQQPQLHERLKMVFRVFEGSVPDYRMVRWWEMQQLAVDISTLPPPRKAGL